MKTKFIFITLIGLFLFSTQTITASLISNWDNSLGRNVCKIENIHDLQKLSETYKTGIGHWNYQRIHFILVDDITLPSNWESIGNANYQFSGSFDGNNHTIINNSNKPLFGYVKGTHTDIDTYIHNLILESHTNQAVLVSHAQNTKFNNINNVTSSLITKPQNQIVGSIVNTADSCEFTNCYNTANIVYTASTTFKTLIIGGLVGSAENCKFNFCSNNGTLKIDANYVTIGSIVGNDINSDINDCTNYASLQINGDSAIIGGIVGKGLNSKILKCTNRQRIKGNSSSIIGGIIGTTLNCRLTECNNKAALSTGYLIGGITGQEYKTRYINCTNSSAINNAYIIGGIVANIVETKEMTSIEQCHNLETATLADGNIIGGITGSNKGLLVIKETSNKGNITTKSIAGGIVGKSIQDTYILNTINIGNVSSNPQINNTKVAGIIAENETTLWISYVGNYGTINGYKGTAAGIVLNAHQEDKTSIEYSVQCSTITCLQTNKIIPISNKGIITQSYYDRELTSSNKPYGKFTAELKNNSLLYAASGNGYTNQNWDFTKGYYLMPTPFTHNGIYDPNTSLTPITNTTTIVFMNNNNVYDYQKDQTNIVFPNNPSEFDGYTFIGWSYSNNGIVLVKNNSSIYAETLNHKKNTELKLYAVWNKNNTWATNASVKELIVDKYVFLNEDASYGQIIVNPGALLTIGNNITITCDKLTLIGKNLPNDNKQGEVQFLDDQSQILITNGWMYARLTNGFDYTYFSLPYDCTKADVYTLETEKSKYGTNWITKSYNAEKRADLGTGTKNWVFEKTPTIKAGIGYIFGTTFDANQTFYFNPSTPQTVLKLETKKIQIKPTHKQNQNKKNNNWNLCGNLYTNSIDCRPLLTNLDNSRTPRNIFVSVPDANNNGATFTYYSTMDGSIEIPAFSVFYTQAASNSELEVDVRRIIHNSPQRSMQVPSSKDPIFNDLTFTCINNENQEKDNMGISLSDQGSLEYEIGFDFEKRIGLKTKPQIYTISDNNKLAFNDLSYVEATNLPMGIYAPIGNYTFSLNNKNQRGIKSVYLFDNKTGLTVDLLIEDFQFHVMTTEETMTRFSITVVQGNNAPTDLDSLDSNIITTESTDNGIVIHNAPLESHYFIYDTAGRCLAQGTTSNDIETVSLTNQGVYMLHIITPTGSKYTYKTIK